MVGSNLRKERIDVGRYLVGVSAGGPTERVEMRNRTISRRLSLASTQATSPTSEEGQRSRLGQNAGDYEGQAEHAPDYSADLPEWALSRSFWVTAPIDHISESLDQEETTRPEFEYVRKVSE